MSDYHKTGDKGLPVPPKIPLFMVGTTGKMMNFILFFVSIILIPCTSLGAYIPATSNIKIFGSYIYNVDPTGSTLIIRGSSYSTATNTVMFNNQTAAGNSTGFRNYMWVYPHKLASSTGNVVTSITFQYVKTGTCITGVALYSTTTASISDTSTGSNAFDAATTSGNKTVNISATDRNGWGFGIGMFGRSSISYCEIRFSSIVDNLGNEYLVPDAQSESTATFLPMATPQCTIGSLLMSFM